MGGAAAKQKQSKRGEVIIAIIGLVGVLITGTLSNWDKLFPKGNLVQATYSGYRPTGHFETEFRYYFEVSGSRQMYESVQRQSFLVAKAGLISKYPNRSEEITKRLNVMEKEAVKIDDVIQVMLPVYQKYFTTTEIQELNKFYSTEAMQNMVKKMPLLAQDVAPIQMEMMNNPLQLLDAQLREELNPR